MHCPLGKRHPFGVAEVSPQTSHPYWITRIENPLFLSCSLLILVIWGTNHVPQPIVRAGRMVSSHLPNNEVGEGGVPYIHEDRTQAGLLIARKESEVDVDTT